MLVWTVLFFLWSGFARSLSPPTTELHARQLISVVPGAQIHPILVDLWDQIVNLRADLAQVPAGSQLQNSVQRQLRRTQAILEDRMRGVAIFAPTTTTQLPAETAAPEPKTSSVVGVTTTVVTIPSTVTITQAGSTTNARAVTTLVTSIITVPISRARSTAVPTVDNQSELKVPASTSITSSASSPRVSSLPTQLPTAGLGLTDSSVVPISYGFKRHTNQWALMMVVAGFGLVMLL